jgi:type IV secretory system conjugative DNA transfer VirD4/TraG family protein
MRDTTAEEVTARLRATGSTDPDVLFAAKTELGGPFVHRAMAAFILAAVGLAATLAPGLAVVGIPLALAGGWYWHRSARNLETIEAAHRQFTQRTDHTIGGPMNEQVLKMITEHRPKPIGPSPALANNWFWKFVPVDPLVFSVPIHDGSVGQVARQVYHRLLSRIVADTAHGMQLALIAAAWVLTIVLGERLGFRGGAHVLLGLAAFGGFLFFAVPVLMRIACSSASTAEALGIVQRTFFRDVPANAPVDLRDDLQHGWLTVDGRPLSAEVSAEDARTTEAAKRTLWWILTAVAIGWAVSYIFTGSSAPAAAAGPTGPDFSADGMPQSGPFGSPLSMLGIGGFFGFLKYFGSFVVLAILLIKIFRDKRPLLMRAHELAVAEAAEGTAYVAAGGQPWGTIPEAARRRQIAEATADTSPTVDLGQTTGIFAARGDYFGPNPGLPFRLSLRDLQMHMLVLGGTGSGKTSGVLRPLARQLSAHEGVGLVVMDGKGALPGELSELPGMRVIDPGQPGIDISLVSGVEPAVIVDTIRDVLAPGAGGENQFWINSAAGALRRGAVIAQAAGGGWWSLFHSAQIVSSKQDRDQLIQALVPKAEEDPLLREAFAYFRLEWDTMDEKTRSNILAEIRSWLSTITATPELLRWAKTPAGKDTVDLLAPLTGGRIGILIPEYRYGVAGSVVSALLKARLFSGLKSRADRDWSGTTETPVAFIIDEAQEVATTQDAQMLPIGRSLGLAMIAATQGLEGIMAKLGPAVASKWLSIFGSVVALGGRSAATDAFVAQRAGESWQLTPGVVIGNTVRGALSMEAISGPIAAARTQPHMAMTVGRGGLALMPSSIAQAATALSKGADLAPAPPPQLALGSRPLFPPGEIASLAAVPDTAIVLGTRGRVARRDVVILKPEYPARKAQVARPRVVAASVGGPREVAAMAASAHTV